MGLFTPKWMTDATEAGKLTDESKLQKAYLKSDNMLVVLTSIRKINDTSFLYEILEGKNMPDVSDGYKKMIKEIAAEKLGILDRELLIKAAAFSEPAIELLYYSEILKLIKSHASDTDDDVISSWMDRIKDKNVLRKIYFSDSMPARLRSMAQKKAEE